LYLQSGILLLSNLLQICVPVLFVTLLVSMVLGADLVASDTSLQNFSHSSLVLYAWIYEVHSSNVAAALCNQTVVNVVVNILSGAID
jgi:hypothetical protein